MLTQLKGNLILYWFNRRGILFSVDSTEGESLLLWLNETLDSTEGKYHSVNLIVCWINIRESHSMLEIQNENNLILCWKINIRRISFCVKSTERESHSLVNQNNMRISYCVESTEGEYHSVLNQHKESFILCWINRRRILFCVHLCWIRRRKISLCVESTNGESHFVLNEHKVNLILCWCVKGKPNFVHWHCVS